MNEYELILKTAEIISWAGVAFVFVLKVIVPVTQFLLDKLKDKNDKPNGYEDRLKKLEAYRLKLQNNDLHDLDDFKVDIKDDIQKLWNKMDLIDYRLREVEKSIAVLKVKVNGTH